jgi:hypothetical protein
MADGMTGGSNPLKKALNWLLRRSDSHINTYRPESPTVYVGGKYMKAKRNKMVLLPETLSSGVSSSNNSIASSGSAASSNTAVNRDMSQIRIAARNELFDKPSQEYKKALDYVGEHGLPPQESANPFVRSIDRVMKRLGKASPAVGRSARVASNRTNSDRKLTHSKNNRVSK